MTQPASKRLVTEATFPTLHAAAIGDEIAYAENGTAVATTIAVSAAASVVIPGTMITIPANSGPVDVKSKAAFNITTPGAGLIALELWDVTAGGVGSYLHSVGVGVVAAQIALYSGLANTIMDDYRVDNSSSDRILQLKALLYRDSGSSLIAQIANGLRNSVGQPTSIKAVKA